MPPVDFNLFYH